jgi:hypothetical protein
MEYFLKKIGQKFLIIEHTKPFRIIKGNVKFAKIKVIKIIEDKESVKKLMLIA